MSEIAPQQHVDIDDDGVILLECERVWSHPRDSTASANLQRVTFGAKRHVAVPRDVGWEDRRAGFPEFNQAFP